MHDKAKSQTYANVDAAEIEKFNAMASRWWDPEGDFRPLHQINPLRVQFIDQHGQGFAGRKILDVGCGGGILTEAMAKAGAEVTGIDMSPDALNVARLHALESGLTIDYQQITAEAFAAENPEQYDIVTCLEMLEHVPDPAAVIAACAQLVKPGGRVVFATLNRTLKAKLLGVFVAEYVLRWVPQGTHDADKFIRPSELIGMAEQSGLIPLAATGIHFNPLLNQFYISDRNLDVNYLVACEKPVCP
ncbi:MAG: bifunctional 2-polyprenyl-6-hydroxyphenol methylase/3-demethylubiquinol 3-O-methyltransferase UbiG [Aliidiomarina sp.]|uniref:bifunctional 2-polyprenyl-6-hydroxyphenol methylase/3-demethylubiquinol 3-O-methyltransferase UbiG n=1 Tax=Aliidiomarina sp. TaxID=1872439 RepID=UPI0025C3C672|nr:bifunctional 2-polyprenyl-6-hydroxyphenol methylase/3-demethylubiquinol 3-O-methyltransferase UbiG [Aliidiomarina sp.]MCH8500342.1 bifunctional 2-polyprenyl-6-hydroxyphenol methylase/3-demethylubiquinol 3-O-methyltransferase UbiG [Aliidiomarina sp.]